MGPCSIKLRHKSSTAPLPFPQTSEETETWETLVTSFNILTITTIIIIIINQPPSLRHKSLSFGLQESVPSTDSRWFKRRITRFPQISNLCWENSNIAQDLSKPTINSYQTTEMPPANSTCQSRTCLQMMMVSKVGRKNILISRYSHHLNKDTFWHSHVTHTHTDVYYMYYMYYIYIYIYMCVYA